MRKKTVLAILVSTIILSVFTTACPAQEYDIRFSISVAPDQPAAIAAKRFAKAMDNKTNGKVHVTVFPSEQLGGEPEVLQGVRIGAIQMAFLSPGALGNIMPDFQILNGPFLWDSWSVAKQVLTGPFGKDLYNRFLKQTGIRVLDPLWYWGWRDMTADRPIRTVQDMQGLKMRSPNIPIFVDMFDALGAHPTTVNFQEIYSALQQGVVDGQENPIPAIWSQHFYEVNDYLSLTRHILQSNLIVINNDFYTSLPNKLQQQLLKQIRKAGEYNTKLQRDAEQDLLNKLRKKGMKIISNVKREEFRKATRVVYDEFKDDWSPGLYEKLQKAIKNVTK